MSRMLSAFMGTSDPLFAEKVSRLMRLRHQELSAPRLCRRSAVSSFVLHELSVSSSDLLASLHRADRAKKKGMKELDRSGQVRYS